jgi:hypothetical protein
MATDKESLGQMLTLLKKIKKPFADPEETVLIISQRTS